MQNLKCESARTGSLDEDSLGQDSPASPLALQDQGSATEPVIDIKESSDSNAVSRGSSRDSSPPPKRQRVLRKEQSEEEDDEELTESIAVRTKDCILSNTWVHPDKDSPAAVEFWLRGYVTYIRRLVHLKGHIALMDCDAGRLQAEELKPHMRLYIRFVIKGLLEHKVYDVLHVFVEHFAVIKASLKF